MDRQHVVMALLAWGLLTLVSPYSPAQIPTASAAPTFEKVIEALGGREKILGIQSFRASGLYSQYVVWRYIREKDVKKTERHYRKQREAWEKKATNKGSADVEKVKALPLPDPTIEIATLEQQHHQLQVELPSKGRDVILSLSTDLKKEGGDVGLDFVEHDGANRLTLQSGNDVDVQKELIEKESDLSYALPLLGMLRTILVDGKFVAEFGGYGDIHGNPIQSFLLRVPAGPYAGSWQLAVNSATQLPVSLEYRDGLPPFFLNSTSTIFSAHVQGTKSASSEKPRGYWPKMRGLQGFYNTKPDVEKALKKYRERVKFAQFFGGFREKQGILYPALSRTIIVLPEKKADREWHSSFAVMSLDWNPAGSYTSLREELKQAVVSRSTQPAAVRAQMPTDSSRAILLELLNLQRFYRQLVWSAVFTSNQFQGRYVRSPRYLVLSPDWARFYSLAVVFPEKTSLNREDLKKRISADKSQVIEIFQKAGPSMDLAALGKAFDDLGEVAKQGLSVYNSFGIVGLQKWNRCFDADNVAVGSARVVLELDRLMERQGWAFRSGREYFVSNGLELAKLETTEIDWERNAKGMSKGGRRGLAVGLVAGAAAGGAVFTLAVPATWGVMASPTLSALYTGAQTAVAWTIYGVIYSAATVSIPNEPPLYVETELAKEIPEGASVEKTEEK
jgi:hypothetical protein